MTSGSAVRLSVLEQHQLLHIARRSVAQTIGPVSTKMFDFDADTPALRQHAGVFVTLRLAKVLRGCIGHVEADRPLVDLVRRVAIVAATEDPRFGPVTVNELPGIVFEVSVLGPLVEHTDPLQIEAGRYGLVVDDGTRHGLLLPQVAVEWGWDTRTFLAETCKKAGLGPDDWRTTARVFVFEAEVFAEDD